MLVFIAVMACIGYAFTITWQNPMNNQVNISNSTPVLLLTVTISGAIPDTLNVSNISFSYSNNGTSYTLIGWNNTFNKSTYTLQWVLPALNGTYVLNATGYYNSSPTLYYYSNSSFITIFIDTLSPVVSFVSPVNNSNSSSQNVTLSFNATDYNLSWCKIWVNQGGWHVIQTISSINASNYSTSNVTTYGEGTYLWNVWCNDTVGNTAWVGGNRTFTVDYTAPIVNASNPFNFTPTTFNFTNFPLKINASVWDNGSGINYVYYILNSQNIGNYGTNASLVNMSGANGVYTDNLTANFTSNYTSPGAHSVYFCAVDYAGNTACNSNILGNNAAGFVIKGGNVTQIEQTFPAQIGTMNITFENGTEVPISSFMNPVQYNYSMIVNSTDSSGRNIFVSIVGFSINETQMQQMDTANMTTSPSALMQDQMGSGFNNTSAWMDISQFLPGGANYRYGVFVFPGTAYNKIEYCNGSSMNDPSCVSISVCSSQPNISNYASIIPNNNACYLLGASNTSIYAAHFSGAQGGLDITPPSVILNAPVSNANVSGLIVINTTISDNNGIVVTVLFVVSNSSINNTMNFTMVNSSTTYLNTSFNTSKFADGFYNITIYANDPSGNINNSVSNQVRIDNTWPVITFDPTANVTNTYTAPSITWLSSEYSNASVEYGTTTTLELGNITGTSLSNNLTMLVSFPAALSAKTLYYYNITTCDYAGNCIENGTYNFTTTAAPAPTAAIIEETSSGGLPVTTVTPGQSSEKMWADLAAGDTVVMPVSKDEIPITEISFAASDKASNVDLKVAELLTPPSTSTSIEGTVYKYMQITITNLADTSINSVTIKFKVEKAWLTTNNIVNENIVLFRYVNNAWQELTTKIISTDTTYVYYESESSGFSYYAVGVTTKQPPKPAETPVQQPPVPPSTVTPSQQPSAQPPAAVTPPPAPSELQIFIWLKNNKTSVALVLGVIIIVGAIIGYEHYSNKKPKKEDKKVKEKK